MNEARPNRERKRESEVTQSCPTLCDPMDCSLPGSPAMEFSRKEYWSGLPFPSPGDLPHPVIEAGSPALWAEALLLSDQESSNREQKIKKKNE